MQWQYINVNNLLRFSILQMQENQTLHTIVIDLGDYLANYDEVAEILLNLT